MQHRRVSAILILTSIFGVGCASNGTATSSADAQSAANTLRRLDDEWSAAAQKGDVEKVASFYADDAIAYPPGEPVVRGREAARKVWAAYFADPKRVNLGPSLLASRWSHGLCLPRTAFHFSSEESGHGSVCESRCGG